MKKAQIQVRLKPGFPKQTINLEVLLKGNPLNSHSTHCTVISLKTHK